MSKSRFFVPAYFAETQNDEQRTLVAFLVELEMNHDIFARIEG